MQELAILAGGGKDPNTDFGPETSFLGRKIEGSGLLSVLREGTGSDFVEKETLN